jgi:hypothetical protein
MIKNIMIKSIRQYSATLNQKLNVNIDILKSNIDYYLPENNYKHKCEYINETRKIIINITKNMLDIINLEQNKINRIHKNNDVYHVIEK